MPQAKARSCRTGMPARPPAHPHKRPKASNNNAADKGSASLPSGFRPPSIPSAVRALTGSLGRLSALADCRLARCTRRPGNAPGCARKGAARACLDQLALELVSHQVHRSIQVVLALLHAHHAVPAGRDVRASWPSRVRMGGARRRLWSSELLILLCMNDAARGCSMPDRHIRLPCLHGGMKASSRDARKQARCEYPSSRMACTHRRV